MAKSSFVSNPARIKVIGLGGGGCNAITRMVREEIQGVEFIAMNTDAQALAITEAPTRIQLGEKLTRGLGVGGDHVKGQKAAEENQDELQELVNVGLSPYEALMSATVHPMEYLGELHDTGTLEIGKRADLVLLGANPLEDIRNARKVMGFLCRGNWLDHEYIQNGMETLAVN